MLKDIIEELKRTDKSIDELKIENAQIKSFLALIVKQNPNLSIDHNLIFDNDRYSVDYDKVKIVPDSNDRLKGKVIYEENGGGDSGG